MEYTPKYNLSKPELAEYADIAVLNDNMDKIEAALEDKPDKTALADEIRQAVQDGALTAADVGAVDAASIGAAGGIASLGADGKIPTGQIPTMRPGDVGAAPAYSFGTDDLTAGSSALETGKLHFVYE